MLLIEVDHCHEVAVDLYANDFVLRWASLFEHTASNCKINQDECFSCAFTEQESQRRLLDSITAINKFFKHNFIQLPDSINWDDQNWYNHLHSKFEQLAGTFEEPSRFFSLAPVDIRSAVRSLNFYIHRLETRPYQEFEFWELSFDKDCYQRLPLMEADYDHFQQKILPGQAFIQYAELGKTTIDLYKDGLPKDYVGSRNLHHYSAEISIHLGTFNVDLFTDDFQIWARHNEIDIDEPKFGLGIIPVGEVRNLDTARQIVYNGSNVTQLRMI